MSLHGVLLVRKSPLTIRYFALVPVYICRIRPRSKEVTVITVTPMYSAAHTGTPSGARLSAAEPNPSMLISTAHAVWSDANVVL